MCKIFGGSKEGHPHHSTQQAGWARRRKNAAWLGLEGAEKRGPHLSLTDRSALAESRVRSGGQKQVSLGGSDTS